MKRLACLGVLLAHAVGADATFRLAPWEHWQHQGNGNGPVHLDVGGKRLEATPGHHASLVVPARGHELVEASVWIGPETLRPRFLMDVQEGHGYTAEPDPCCFFQIGDDDPSVGMRCVGEGVECPSGLVGVDKFHSDAECGGRKKTCAPPARLRVEGGVADIAFDDDEPRRFGAGYRRLHLGRAVPMRLTILRNGATAVVWVLFRLGGRYTLVPGAVPRIVRDR